MNYQPINYTLPTISKPTKYKVVNYTKRGIGIHKPPMETKFMEDGNFAIADIMEQMILSEDKTGINQQEEFWWEKDAGIITMEIRDMQDHLLDLFYGWANDFNAVFLARCARKEKFNVLMKWDNDFRKITSYNASIWQQGTIALTVKQNNNGEWYWDGETDSI